MSSPARVFVTRSLPGDALGRLSARTDCEVDVWSEPRQPTSTELAERATNCDGLLCLLTDRIDDELLARCASLQVVSTCSVGVDHIDLASASRRSIKVGYTPGVLVDTTADLTWALLLAASRRIVEADAFVRSGEWTSERRWEPEMLLGRDVARATLGILGLGAIGQAVARRAKGFEMRVVGWTPSARKAEGIEALDFDEVLAESDFLSIHLALSSTTRGLIGAEEFARMKPGAVLVNAARGGIVNEEALASALASGQLSAAGLDVFDVEPLPSVHPLRSAPNLVLAPHIGSASVATRARMADLAVDNLLAGLSGEPLPHCANPEVEGAGR